VSCHTSRLLDGVVESYCVRHDSGLYMGCCQSSSAVAVKGNDEVKQESLVESYVASMNEQFRKAIGDPDKLEDTALSKRSPFKMARDNSKHNIDVNLGSTAVARCDMSTDFGQRFAKVIDQLQDLAWERLGMANCKRQTTPHMSIGSVVLDRHSPEAYNEAVREHSGQLAKVKAYLDGADPPARARIQALKINPDGCVTFQLEHDPRQDVIMTDDELVTALRKVPTCSTEEALAGEKKKFAACGVASRLRAFSRYASLSEPCLAISRVFTQQAIWFSAISLTRRLWPRYPKNSSRTAGGSA